MKRLSSTQSPHAGDSLAGVASPRGRAAAAFAASVRFEDVQRRYADMVALKGVSLEIAPGEVVCLLGPSGCGKTTLLRIAAGIEKPSGGRVLINEHEVAGPNRFVPPEQRGVGLMFQDFALFPHLSIADNVAFGLKALPRQEARREALTMLARVGLDTYADEFPHILSGGQQQRVALARALAPRPAVVLMDEPFSGLDVQLRDNMQEETLALLRETRATAIIVTHHPEEAMQLADRVAVMRSGEVVQTGKAQDLYDSPKELFVARLFSEINELTYPVSKGSVSTPFGTFPARSIDDGELAVVCVRERGVRVLPAGRPGIQGRVLHVRFLGDVQRLEIGAAGFEVPLRARSYTAEGHKRGSEVSIEIDPREVLVFARGPRGNGDGQR